MVYIVNDVGRKAAVIAGNSPQMDATALAVKRALMAEAARHNLTSAFMNSFEIDSVPGAGGVSDRAVYTTDPGARSIEYGHIAGKHPHKESQVVPGKHVFARVSGRTIR